MYYVVLLFTFIKVAAMAEEMIAEIIAVKRSFNSNISRLSVCDLLNKSNYIAFIPIYFVLLINVLLLHCFIIYLRTSFI